MAYIDTHAHLDQEDFDGDRPEVVARARTADVEAIVCVGVSAASSRITLALAEEFPELYAAVGIQPNNCAEAGDGDWQQVVEMACGPRVVALGETGLDRYWDFTPIDLQRDFLRRHLRLAAEHELPVIIHCREAEADLLPIVRETPVQGVLHAFSGDAAFAEECLALGLYISFAGMVTYKNKKFVTLREAAKIVPEDRLLIETDSPYLVPHPLRGKQKRNEPALVVHTAEALAQLRGVDPTELATATTANARRLFRLP